MAQDFKAVYFSDFPAESAKQKSLTLAFGAKTKELYKAVRDLSSEEVRLLLKADNYDDIITAAAPAFLWRQLSFPSWSMSNPWVSCFMVPTRYPRWQNSAISFSNSVVFPLSDFPTIEIIEGTGPPLVSIIGNDTPKNSL